MQVYDPNKAANIVDSEAANESEEKSLTSQKNIQINDNNDNNYTNCTKSDKSLINKGVQVVQLSSSNYTSTVPIYTKNLQGVEKLTDEEVVLLASMNKKYSQTIIGGKHKIVSTKHCAVNGMTTVFEDITQFPRYFDHEKRVASENRGKAWLQWEGKSFFPDGVGFYPDMSKCPKDVYNFFSGLPIKPEEGDCTIYLNHIKEGICSGDNVASAYFIQWLAHMIQKPDEKPSVAILMKSVEGTGKGTLVKPLLEILGEYGAQVNGHRNLTDKFNNTLANKLLVFGDEVDLKETKS